MLSSLFAKTQKAAVTSAVRPLRLTTIEEDPADRESFNSWEQVIKGTIEHASRFLLGMAQRDVTARLLRLEPTPEEVATDRLGGPTAPVSALYLHLNTPSCTGSCVALALQLEFVSFLSRLTRQVAMDTSDAPSQGDSDHFQQVSTMLGYSLTFAAAELCCARPQYSPPVIIIGTARTFVDLARIEMPEGKNDSQFLTGVIGITAGKDYFEGTFALYCPSSVLEWPNMNSNAQPSHKWTALRLPTLTNYYQGGSNQRKNEVD